MNLIIGVEEEGENCLTDGYTLCGAPFFLHKLRTVGSRFGLD